MNRQLKIDNIIALCQGRMITSLYTNTPETSVEYYKRFSPYLFEGLTETDIKQIIETLKEDEEEV